MANTNTQVGLLTLPSDHHSSKSSHVIPWQKAGQVQSSHPALSSFLGNSSCHFSQPPLCTLDPGVPLETSFFQSASRANVSFQKEARESFANIFQSANRSGDISPEQALLHSVQRHPCASHVFTGYEDLQNVPMLGKQQGTDVCSGAKTLGATAPTQAHAVAKRVPVFKTARNKTSNTSSASESKLKKRFVPPSEEGPLKKHSGPSSFTHSQISAFKPVATNGIVKSACDPSIPFSAKKLECVEESSDSQHKTLPVKPKFGKSHLCLNKRIKREKTPHVTKPPKEQTNREGSHAAVSGVTGEKSEITHGMQAEPFCHSSLPLVKKELNGDEENLDITGTSGMENGSELEVPPHLKPTQCQIPDKKNVIQVKKNLPSTLGSKKKKLQETKGSKKRQPKVNECRKEEVSSVQGTEVKQRSWLQSTKCDQRTVPQAAQDRKIRQSQAIQVCEVQDDSRLTENNRERNPISDCKNKQRNLTDTVRLSQKNKAPIKSCSLSSTTKQKPTKADLPLQMEEDTSCSYAGDQQHIFAASEDITKNTLRSSPLSHEVVESSFDSPESRLSPELSSVAVVAQETSQKQERSLEKSTGNEESSRGTDEETAPLSEAVKESVVKLLNTLDNDLWVQCDKCLKWRKLDHILDPATLPDKWYCTMLPAPGKNSCQEPEEEWDADEKYIYYEHQFVVGSVVWAQVPGSPWWPAMVDIDPDYRRYDWFNSIGTYPTSYHVTFFGDPVMRAWVTCRNIRIFRQHDSYKKFNDGKKDLSRDISLRKAVQEASYALSMEVQHRRRMYAFVVRYSGKIRRKSSVSSHSETSNVKTSTPLPSAKRRQKKECKELLSAVSPLVMEPSSKAPVHTTAVNDNVRNRRSQLLQEYDNDKHSNGDKYASGMDRKERDSGEIFNEQNLNFSQSENEKEHMDKKEGNGGDPRPGAEFLGTVNVNNNEKTLSLEHCNVKCLQDDLHQERGKLKHPSKVNTAESNTSNIQKGHRQVTGRIANTTDTVKNCKGTEEILGNKEDVCTNNSTMEGNMSSNEVQETDLQENEETTNHEEKVPTSDESSGQNSYMSGVVHDDPHDTDEHLMSSSYTTAMGKRDQDNEIEHEAESVSKTTSDDDWDIYNSNIEHTNNERETCNGQLSRDYEEGEQYIGKADTESNCDGVYASQYVDANQNAHSKLSFVADRGGSCKEHYRESYHQEQYETEVDSKQRDSASSSNEHYTESSFEYESAENEPAKNDSEANEVNANLDFFEGWCDYELNGNESKCEGRQDSMGGDYEQEIPYGGQDDNGICKGQDNRDCEDDKDDFKQGDEYGYEVQDNTQNREQDSVYQRQECEDNCSAQVNCDYDDEFELDNEYEGNKNDYEQNNMYEGHNDYDDKDNDYGDSKDDYDQDNDYEGNKDDYEQDNEYEGHNDYEGNKDDYEQDNEYEGHNNYDDNKDDFQLDEYEGHSDYEGNKDYFEKDDDYEGHNNYDDNKDDFDQDNDHEGCNDYECNEDDYEQDNEYVSNNTEESCAAQNTSGYENHENDCEEGEYFEDDEYGRECEESHPTQKNLDDGYNRNYYEVNQNEDEYEEEQHSEGDNEEHQTDDYEDPDNESEYEGLEKESCKECKSDEYEGHDYEEQLNDHSQELNEEDCEQNSSSSNEEQSIIKHKFKS